MTPRAQRLLAEAAQQIDALAGNLAAAGEAALARPCPGRGKLGDGTVGAVAAHTAGNYLRVADFLRTRANGGAHHPGSAHAAGLSAESIHLGYVLDRLEEAKGAWSVLANLDDRTLEDVPPAGGMKFADGERTLEVIVASILKHQRHQIDALVAAVA